MALRCALMAEWSSPAFRWVRPAAYAFGVLMFANGLGHVAAFLALGRVAPSVDSSPLWLAASGWLFLYTRQHGTA